MTETITKDALKQVYNGVIIYTVVSLIGGIISVIAVFTGAVGVAAAVARDDLAGAVGAVAGVGLVAILVSVAVIVGLVMYIMGLRKFAPTLDEMGKKAINQVLLGLYIMIGASILSIIPLLGLVSGLVSLVGFIIQVLGFSAFRDSTSLNEEGKDGAKKLFNAMIISIVAGICVFIPLIGSIAALVLNILYYVFLISGWGKVRKSFGA